MNHIDLFSGIGGFALAASRIWGHKHNIMAFCEIDVLCQKILKKHWPDTPIISDIRRFNEKVRPNQRRVDLLTGGFPCQGFSTSGHRKGTEDDRYLWPEMLKVIDRFKPTWIIGENVTGIITLALDTVLSDLENIKYSCRGLIIPACSVGALHKRDRVWIIAHSNEDRGHLPILHEKAKCTESTPQVSSNTPCRIIDCGGRTKMPLPINLRVDNGVSSGVDRVGALGNAIVPQVAENIFLNIRKLGYE